MSSEARSRTIMSICSWSHILEFSHFKKFTWIRYEFIISTWWGTNVILHQLASLSLSHFTHLSCDASFWTSSQGRVSLNSLLSCDITEESFYHGFNRSGWSVCSAKSRVFIELPTNWELNLSSLSEILESKVDRLPEVVLLVTCGGVVLYGESI